MITQALRVILGALSFTPAYMRQFVVIFLLILLPIQVLAESLEDLSATHHRAALVETVDVASICVDTAARLPASVDASSPHQAVHADISDSMGSASPNVQSAPLVDPWPEYRPFPFPPVYFTVIKPPRI